jgi:hypothetical protein
VSENATKEVNTHLSTASLAEAHRQNTTGSSQHSDKKYSNVMKSEAMKTAVKANIDQDTEPEERSQCRAPLVPLCFDSPKRGTIKSTFRQK